MPTSSPPSSPLVPQGSTATMILRRSGRSYAVGLDELERPERVFADVAELALPETKPLACRQGLQFLQVCGRQVGGVVGGVYLQVA